MTDLHDEFDAFVNSEDRPQPESDLHNLWGWGERIRLRVANGHPANECDPWNFLPDESASAAMMRLGVNYPQVIKQIDDSLGLARRRFDEFSQAGTDANSESFLDAVRILQSRVSAGSETIRQAEAAADDGRPEAPKEKRGRPTTAERNDIWLKEWREQGQPRFKDFAEQKGVDRSTVSKAIKAAKARE